MHIVHLALAVDAIVSILIDLVDTGFGFGGHARPTTGDALEQLSSVARGHPPLAS